MSLFHKCDRCGREIKPKEPIRKINYTMNFYPRINDIRINDKVKDNLENLEFCEDCSIIIVDELHEAFVKLTNSFICNENTEEEDSEETTGN